MDRARLALLDEAKMSIIRAHASLDPTYVVPEFARAIGLTPPVSQGPVWSLHEEALISLHDLAARAANGIRMTHLRVTGEPNREVTRVATMVGGLGLDRHVDYWERNVMGLDIQVIITGETNDFAQRFAVDSGIGLLETCHSACEEPGLEAFARDLSSMFPAAEFIFHKEVVPWTTV